MTTTKKRKLSGFDLHGAMKLLGIRDLEHWQLDCAPVTPSPFFAERMRRLSECFDVMGALSYVFGKCEENLAQQAQAA